MEYRTKRKIINACTKVSFCLSGINKNNSVSIYNKREEAWLIENANKNIELTKSAFLDEEKSFFLNIRKDIELVTGSDEHLLKKLSLKHKLKLDIYLKCLDDMSAKFESKKSKAKNVEELPWFKIGLRFATGEMDKLIKNRKVSWEDFTKELFPHEDHTAYRPYISMTAGSDKKRSDKNIYQSEKKLKIINDHCIKGGIETTPYFKARIQAIST